MAPVATKAQLQKQVEELTLQLGTLQTANGERNSHITALMEMQDRLTAQLHDAEARATAAQTEAAAAINATAAAAAAAAAAGVPPVELVPKPKTYKFNIRREMRVTYEEFCAIRATIHTLVKSTQLSWREDFRRQDPAALALLFKSARKEHPILRNYTNNWATAAIAKTYMQNMRKHARRRGYIPRYQPGNARNDQ
ncbi:hypothetical protein BD310DRAFT_908305 [Dichomitus squalens]|uniref:Uncharacterized protein n=1 Tax=Dichomitus squalens TaxID=114155 RepID=A0A4Q9PMS1_9APHY|nr:hypothetical protein BD310DRAFT_908305 [Dichomitus squalens]